MSDSVRPHRRQPTRLPRPWDSPGKNTGVGCHFLLQCMKVESESEVAQSFPTPRDPMDCSPPGSSVHGIFQARVLEWGAIAFSPPLAHLVVIPAFGQRLWSSCGLVVLSSQDDQCFFFHETFVFIATCSYSFQRILYTPSKPFGNSLFTCINCFSQDHLFGLLISVLVFYTASLNFSCAYIFIN